MPDTIPIFPLETVLLPGQELPVHVFEPRYRRLRDDVGEHGAFGVVAVFRGRETTQDVTFAEVGTLAEILAGRAYPDGSSDLLTVGTRRFRVLDVDSHGKPYLQADIHWLEEDDGPLAPSLVAAAREGYERYVSLLARVSRGAPGEPLSADPLRASYEIAARLPLGVADRQPLLAAPTTAARLSAECAVLRRETVLLRETRTVQVPTRVVQLIPRWS